MTNIEAALDGLQTARKDAAEAEKALAAAAEARLAAQPNPDRQLYSRPHRAVVDLCGRPVELRHFLRDKVMMTKNTSNAAIRRMLIRHGRAKDGKFDLADFRRFLMALHVVLPEQELKACFELFDINHDGTVDYSELATWCVVK
eukprot:SAG31_NODE_3228_length_4517_cov_2.643730_4_plen_143_part_01